MILTLIGYRYRVRYGLFGKDGIMKILFITLFLGAAVAFAVAPTYGPMSYVQCNGTNIDVGYYGAPCVVDWNNDGIKDVILGIFSYGNIYYYENVGTGSSPLFTSYSILQADGTNITLPYG